MDLQELAANSDRLVPTLIEFLLNQPNESDDLVQEKDFELFDRLRESALLALASVSSTREEIRMKVRGLDLSAFLFVWVCLHVYMYLFIVWGYVLVCYPCICGLLD